ncbi:MAG: energy-coupling factor transporter ATPase [Vulcanimicrobiota bacterium]
MKNGKRPDIIQIKNLSYSYQKGTPFEHKALNDINVTVKKGEIIGIIGPTGSGKSTFVQHLNGLLKPSQGEVIINGIDINLKPKKQHRKELFSDICFQVGLVFQYPEYQLFEETVYEDIAFGPKNMELNNEEVAQRVKEAMDWVGLDFEKYKFRSPFSLSGGEMRRVALAGILAMKPSILVLDEPTAGLDPRGRIELYERLNRLQKDTEITLVMVSHDMGDVASMVEHLIVFNKGEIAFDGPPALVFKNTEGIKKLGLGVPPVIELMNRLRNQGMDIKQDVIDLDSAEEALCRILKTNN